MQYRPTKLGKLTWSRHEKRFYIYDGSNWIPLDDNGKNLMIESNNIQEAMNDLDKKVTIKKYESSFLSNFATAVIWGIVTMFSVYMISDAIKYGFDKIQTLPQQEVEIRRPN